MSPSIHGWDRKPRDQVALPTDHGVYALFLRAGAKLMGVTPGERGLLYIGLAANRSGLRGRCHFNARTANHSPRKSLAVLLMDELALEPVLITKPNSSNTWGLTPVSDRALTAWMHANLELAIFPCTAPEPIETELIRRFAPPLNLAKQLNLSADHQRISAARSAVLAGLERRRTAA